MVFVFVLPCALLFKLYNKIIKRDLWLVCEDGLTARDNGYYFYKYVREKHPTKYCFYVIGKHTKDYTKVKKYNNIINFRSFKHWIYYLAANLNISSQKNGNPNQPFFYVIHVSLGWFKNRVFLQHGVIKDYCEWLIYKNTKFKYFICGAKKEYEYIRDFYGYPKNSVVYTGLARFDTLHNFEVNPKQILIMPTWRNWLGRETNFLGEKINFCDTEFYKNWNKLLNEKKLIDYIEKNNIELLFYPHINMQKYLKKFKVKSKNIKLLNITVDIQKVLKESSLLLTDYSSVFMDFGYMKKSIIYFQFDKKEFREKQYQKGYFSYVNDGFGPITYDVNETVEKIINYCDNQYKVPKKYLNRMDNFFEINDINNCERIYNTLNQKK